jgi:serine/threonine protein phosphatase 1
LVFGLWKPKKKIPTLLPASTGGELIYAIGDIHGRIDLLDKLVDVIRSDISRHDFMVPMRIIFLGDYIDRGSASRQVIDRILSLEAEWRTVAIMGNHEDALLQFLDNPDIGPSWAQHGGAETLISYGVDPPANTDEGSWARTRDLFAAKLPVAHEMFFRRLLPYTLAGDYLFVHAGVRPKVRLEDQTAQDLMWIRREFVECEKSIDKVVVHGHTPSELAHVGRWRIGVDTGAYATGVLTAIRLFNEERDLLDTRLLSR